MNEDRLRTETVYKGCTRPAMLFGVPITAFVLCVGGSAMLLFVLLSPPLGFVKRFGLVCNAFDVQGRRPTVYPAWRKFFNKNA